MKVIHGARRSGKTTQLIKEAAGKDAVIVCHSAPAAKAVAGMAKDMGINIRQPLTLHMARRRCSYSTAKVFIDNAELVLQELMGLYTRMHVHTITINDESNIEQRYINGDPDFSDAEAGDLVWNDAYGLGRIKALTGGAPFGDIIIAFDNVHASCTKNGKYCKDSPKPTFFYSDGKGNNYLTKRPKQEIDFTNLVPGTQIKLCDGAVGYFLSYVPLLSNPICVATGRNKDGVFYGVRFIYKHTVKSVEAE